MTSQYAATDAAEDQDHEEQEQPKQQEVSIADQVRAVLGEQLGPLGQAVQGLYQRMAQWEGDRAVLTELATGNRRLQAQIETMYDLTIPAEDREAARQKVAQQLETQETKDKLARLERTQQQPSQQQATNPQALQRQVDDHYETVVKPQLVAYARKQGVDFEKAHDTFPKSLRPATGDPMGWGGYLTAAMEAVDKLADNDRKEQQPRPRTDTSRPSGGGRTNYSQMAVRDIPDDVFMKDFAEIARQRVEAARRR